MQTRETRAQKASAPFSGDGAGSAAGADCAHPAERDGSRPERTAFFVPFRIDGQPYALPLAQVEQVIRMAALVKVPGAPGWIAGLLNLHRTVVPVLDLRERFSLAQKKVHPDDRLLLVRTQDKRLAVMADAVSEVLEVNSADVDPPPPSTDAHPAITAVVRSEEEFILVLNANELEPQEKAATDG